MTKLQEDILVSVCVPDATPDEHFLQSLQRIAQDIAQHFRYWEFLVVVSASEFASAVEILKHVPNIRLLKVSNGLDVYQKRVVGASEAIGDVVVLASALELGKLSIVTMIEHAARDNQIVVGQHTKSSIIEPFIRALGKSSGFHVSVKDMRTNAIPRTSLNKILQSQNPALILRFPPRDGQFQVQSQSIEAGETASPMDGDYQRRLKLFQWLLTNSAPTVLTFVSLLSVAVILSSFSFLVYTIAVWIFLETVQPGWVTTSLVMSFSSGFLGVAIFGLSAGLQKVIDLLSDRSPDQILDEESSVDLFGQVLQELNVEIPDVDGPALAPDRTDLENKVHGTVGGQ